MDTRGIISLVLNAHLPFVRDFQNSDDLFLSVEEDWFFESLSETYLPLLGFFDRLDADHIPFRIRLSVSPLLCQMLEDQYLLRKYLAYTDRQIEFGRKEMERTSGQPELSRLAKYYLDLTVERRIAFTERYEGNVLKVFDYYQRKGKIEILGTSATYAYLPFLCPFSESIQAQLETALACYRQIFGRRPLGLWLPELGWSGGMEPYLRSYNFSYTIVDAHGFIFGKPHPARGCFYPVKTPSGIFILSRDFCAGKELGSMNGAPYRDNNRDAGYDLLPEEMPSLISANGIRMRSGFKYWAGQNKVYDPQGASDRAVKHARAFLENQCARLEQAANFMEEVPLCLCACNADNFGRFWYEGPQFIEALFRLIAGYRGIQFLTPSEYICKQDVSAIETSIPEFSSSGFNGYAETWLDSANDWLYRHLLRAQDRMIELAQRFPDDSGLKERALNQAARELLLAQASDWPRLLYKQESTEYAHAQIEDALRNFTTIYEALGSNYISTDWLTRLERRHNVFPNINYRVFRKKS
jgi:1,4-alpha-glucan branching enzyme